MMQRFSYIGAAMACLLVLAVYSNGSAAVCSNPGADGPGSISSVVNSYYPGTGTVTAGSTSIPVNIAGKRGASANIAAGDLVIVMQIQDADIDSSNTSSYGGSQPGTGYTALNNSGVYEYAVVSSSYTTGSSPITITAPLANSYRTAAASGTSGQRTFQVIRVPQYSSATLIGTVIASVWDGGTGGVVAFDVAGNLAWGGQAIDVLGRGFRGGAARQLAGGTGTNTDYRTLSTVATNGGKGEGIAGTPRWMFIPTTPGSNAAGANIDTTIEGYPNGSHARGAPGNAGGGGSDGNPAANDQNTGGGGGGAYSVGGMGGYGWTPGTPPGFQTGGYGGYSVLMSPGRLTMGGGGGAGSTNNGTGTPGAGLASSGAAGGGIVIIRSRTISGTGTINASGTSANSSITNDASGGGGAGGAVLVFATNSGLGTLTVSANGGNGGSNTGGGSPHGPGGGGSGGFVALSTSSGVTVNVNAGSNGTTAASTTTTPPYGSTASAGGWQIYTLQPTDLPGAGSNALCSPLLTVTKSTGKSETVQGGTTTYTLTVGNQAGYGLATGVTLSDVLPGLPAPFTLATTDSVTLSGGATRPVVTNPAAGATTPAWSRFSIPGGGSVAVTFTASVPAGTTVNTYQNPGNVLYDDPTRTAAGQTVTPGGTYAGGGTVPGSNYASGSSTQDDVSVRQSATIVKGFSPVSISAGGTTQLSIAITNPNAIALTNAAFSDTYPAGLSNSATPAAAISGSGCSGTLTATPNSGSLALTGGVIPSAATCTVTVTVTSATAASYTNTIPAGGFTSSQGVVNTVAAGATLLARPTIVKAFSPIAVPINTNSTLSFVISNPNASQALTGTSFNDTFPPNLVTAGGAVAVAGTGCAGFLPATTVAGATSFALTAGTIPAGGSCTVSFAVRSALAGNYPNTAGGVTTSQTVDAGAASAIASLGVGLINSLKSIAPGRIQSGGTATVTVSLTNPTGVAQTNGSFSDSLTGMQATGGAVGGTCTGTVPNTLIAGATSLTFSGINIPSAGCTVTFAVTSSTPGSQTNSISGVSTALLPAGPLSNTATLDVTAPAGIAKSFAPAIIQQGRTSTLTFSLTNSNSIPLTGAGFGDTLTSMQILANGPAGGTCSGASSNVFTAGQTVLTFSGLTVPSGGGGCTVTVVVTSSVASPAIGHANTASGVSSTETATGSPSAVAYLKVAATPTISKAFGPATVGEGSSSTITFTLANAGNIPLTGATFSDTLTNMQVSASGAAGGTCTGASSNSFSAGQVNLSFSGITIPAAGNCSVTVTIKATVAGTQANTASGVTTTETPVAGSPSNTASLLVLAAPRINKSFAPGLLQIVTPATSTTLTLVVSNLNNATALTNVAFSDALTNMVVFTPSTTTNSCGGTLTATAGSGSITLTGGSLAAGGICTVTVRVTSSVISPAGGHPNTTSGATSTETPVPGPSSNTAYLSALKAPTVSKAFDQPAIVTGGTAIMTLTLTNPNPVNLTAGSFSDTFPANLTTTNLAQNYIGTGRGSCTGVIPSAQVAGTNYTTRTFSGIVIPANGSCTIMVDLTSATAGNYSNTTTGLTTAQTPTIGPVSNTATLAVGRIGISKAFSPATIATNSTSTITFTLDNNSGGNRTAITFRDQFPANMSVAAPLTVLNTCGGTLRDFNDTVNLAAGQTGLRLINGTLNNGSTCQVTVLVTVSAAGSYLNNSTNLTYSGPGAGPDSNVATLTAVNRPTIAKGFSPATIDVYGISTLTFTLSNPNGSTLTNAVFTDTLTGFSVAAPAAIGGTCAGVISTPALAAGATSLNLAVPNLPSGSCTITIPVTSSTAGAYSNTTSGITTSQTGATAGAVSNTAPLTVNRLPLQVTKAPNVSFVAPGGTVNYTIGYGNPNVSTALQNIVIDDPVPVYTTFLGASCGPLPPGITSCTISAPAVGGTGTVTWTLGGSLNPGSSGTVSLSVQVR
jgi:hypothetical protein